MFSLNLTLRNTCLRTSAPLQLRKLLSSTSKDDSESSDSSDDEVEKKKQVKNAEALKRLNVLLESMVKIEKPSSPSTLDLKLAKPRAQIKRKKEEPVTVSDSSMSGDTMVDATRKVAESLGGDVEQTESELLTKLRTHMLNGERGAKQTINLSDLIVGMKIDRTPKPSGEAEGGRAQQVRYILGVQQKQTAFDWRSSREGRPSHPRHELQRGQVNLFGGEPLRIFKPDTQAAASPQLRTWKRLQQRELKLAVTHPPCNVFQEMILWTEQGKLWKFPINNEQGLDEEAKVCFTEHVFLEGHLEPWCPRQGPIRHFMELVCVGLSKNPYLSVEDKRVHIDWFRQYFEKKQDLLKEVGALFNPVSQKTIEA